MTTLAQCSSSELISEIEHRGYLVVESARNEDIGLKFLRDFRAKYKIKIPTGRKYQRMLGAMVSKINKPVSYKTLDIVLWGDEPDGGPGDPKKNVHVMVCRLRAVLGISPYRIDTVWNFGFMLRDIRKVPMSIDGVIDTDDLEDGHSVAA